MDRVSQDLTILNEVVQCVRAAGRVLKTRFTQADRPSDWTQLRAALDANDKASLQVLRDGLSAARPGAGWVEDEDGEDALPGGEWWIADPVEGNINHIQGLPEWAVSATLVRDNFAVLTVVDLPLAERTYTAYRGGGAHVGDRRLRASRKTDLGAALVATGQAKAFEDAETYEKMGRSVRAMLEAALVMRMMVPATLPLLEVAEGGLDLFWQHSGVRAGLVTGALLVQEAGGTVTDLQGRPWAIGSTDFLASAPGLSAAALRALS